MRPMLLALLVAAPAGAFWLGARSRAVRADVPPVVDGVADEWSPRPGDDDEGFAYAFANDGASLWLLVAPHTRQTRDQLAGAEGADFSVWLSTRAARDKGLGFILRAPAVEGAAQGKRMVRYVGVPAWADSRLPGGIEVRLGPAYGRGALEARVPLRLFGAPPPRRLFVGFEAPALKARHSGSRAGADGGDRLVSVTPLQLWIQVRLAEPP